MVPTCRLCVASLSDHNAGVLHGRWIDVTDADAMRDEINAMLAASPTAKREGSVAEENAVHDYDGFGSIHLGEHPDLDAVVALAEGIGGPSRSITWASDCPASTA